MKKVVVYAKPYHTDNLLEFPFVGQYQIDDKVANRLDNAGLFIDMFINKNKHRIKTKKIWYIHSWDEGYGDPENPNEYAESDFAFMSGLEHIEGFNFVYKDGYPHELDVEIDEDN